MFGRKKEIPNNNTYMDMWDSLTEKSFVIQDSVTCVQQIMKAIGLYPEGPDKKAEERELARAKELLIRAIADYDGQLAELKRFYESHYDELKCTKQADWRPSPRSTSHQIIRNLCAG